MNQPKHPIEVAYKDLRQDLINYITNFVESKGGVFYFIGEYDASTPEGLEKAIQLFDLNKDLTPITSGLTDMYFEIDGVNVTFPSVTKIELVNSITNVSGKQLKFSVFVNRVLMEYHAYETELAEYGNNPDWGVEVIKVSDLHSINYFI